MFGTRKKMARSGHTWIGQTEATGSEEVAASRMPDRGQARDESPSLPNTFATWRWTACSPTMTVPWGGTLVLPFARLVAVVACGTSTYPQAPGVERQRRRYPPRC